MKNKVLKTLTLLLPIWIAGVFATSCNTDSPGVVDIYTDIATFVSSNSTGSVFTLRQNADSAEVTLTFPTKVDTESIKPGTRVLLAYSPDNGKVYESGPATMYGLYYVYNGVITESTAEATDNWSTMDQNVVSIWRTGKWLNFNVMCRYVTEPLQYDLVVDEATLNTSCPTVYLLYKADNTVAATVRRFYASFNISELWNNPEFTGFTLKVKGVNGMETFNFDKDVHNFHPAN